MINKNNELPSFVNETNLPKIVDKLSNASNIKITENKYGNRVQTVIDKIVEKADDVTKAIKQEVVNNSYSFKIGTGNVDVSADVQDGFGEVGVKGVTYQNIFNNFSFSSEASKYITVNENTIKWTKSAVTTSNVNIKYHNSLAQLGKTYTLVFYIYKNTLQREEVEGSYNVAKFNIVSHNSGVCFIPVNKTGLVKVKLIQPTTTPSDGKPYLEVYDDSVGEFEISYPILLEGDCTSDDNIPSSYFEGIVGVGDKSKNLFNGKNVSIGYLTATGAINASGTTCRVTDYIEVKSNTSYTVNNPANETHCFYDSDKNFISYVGARTFITPVNCKYVRCTIKRADYDNTFQLEEGEISTQYEPYYDGHKIEILSHGKNLYKPNLQTKSANGLTFSLHGNTLIVNGTCTRMLDFRPISGTESVTLELYNYVNKLPVGTTLKLSNNLGLKNYFALKRNGEQTYLADTLVIQEGYYSIGCFVRFQEGQSYNNAELKIQLEINNVATEFEPYVSDKTQILLDEPLMRLPNGVCDEITRDGKLIRRVGKYVFDGLEAWNKTEILTNTTRYSTGSVLTNKLKAKTNAKCYCDIVPNMEGNEDVFHARFSGGTPVSQFMIWIEPSKLTVDSNTGFMNWLKSNPVTVYYELAEPIITELPAPYLRIFKDGHLTFNTLVAPESNHVVQLNKSGQIQNAIKESQSLDNRINVLENNYDNLMLSTISRLNDLELDYTLK